MHERPERPVRRAQRRTIEAHVRLAFAPPDEELLQRYFEERVTRSQQCTSGLTDADRRWVLANLEYNPAWQRIWRMHEAAVRTTVNWRLSESVQHDHSARPARMRRRESILVKIASRTMLTAIMMYSALWLGGRASLPHTYYLAAITEYEAFLTQQSRSKETPAANAFSKAAKALLASKRNVLGVFPYFDQNVLDSAARHLEDAYDASADPFQRAECAFFRAKVSLMRGDAIDATHWLSLVEEQQVFDYRKESSALIDELK